MLKIITFVCIGSSVYEYIAARQLKSRHNKNNTFLLMDESLQNMYHYIMQILNNVNHGIHIVNISNLFNYKNLL